MYVEHRKMEWYAVLLSNVCSHQLMQYKKHAFGSAQVKCRYWQPLHEKPNYVGPGFQQPKLLAFESKVLHPFGSSIERTLKECDFLY